MNQRSELTGRILAAKVRLGLTWATIAASLGAASEVWYTAALLGNFPLSPEEAAKVVSLLELKAEDGALLAQPPERGVAARMPPTDPLIYRFYELVQNYGSTWKQLIEEKFGDGIMSAIDFNMSIEREPDPKGDRVRMVMSGKFLPYRRY